MDWSKNVSYSQKEKESFHRTAQSRLRKLADALGFAKGDYDIRSNKGGPAVSGEITLHHDRIYVQVAQSFMGPSKGIMVRTCEGRKDYTGGPNNFLPLSLLDDVPALAAQVRKVMPQTVEEAREEQRRNDEAYHRLGS